MRWPAQFLLITLLLGAAIGAPTAALRTADSAEERTREAEQLLGRPHQALTLAAGARASALAYVLIGGAELRTEYQTAVAAAREELRQLQAQGPATEEAAAAARALEQWIQEGPNVFLAMAEAGNREGAAALARTGRAAELFAAFAEAGGRLSARLGQIAEDRREAQRRATVGAFVLFGLGMVATAATLLGAARMLADIRRARRAAREA